MNPETTEELLARLEREHVAERSWGSAFCKIDRGQPYPCETALLVGHARSLEAARRIPRESQSEERP